MDSLDNLLASYDKLIDAGNEYRMAHSTDEAASTIETRTRMNETYVKFLIALDEAENTYKAYRKYTEPS